jgi:hypothetical protein
MSTQLPSGSCLTLKYHFSKTLSKIGSMQYEKSPYLSSIALSYCTNTKFKLCLQLSDIEGFSLLSIF